MTFCLECGEEIKTTEYSTHNDEPICENCFDRYYILCDECGAAVEQTDSLPVWENLDDVRFLCPRCALACANFYFECDHCGRHVARGMVHYDENLLICEACSDEYFFCVDCGRLIHERDLEEFNNAHYCADCYEEKITHHIHNYDYSPEPHFYGCKPGESAGYGVELEIDNGRDIWEAAGDISHAASGHVYLKHDGSLEYGFEIVTHPATVDYHCNHFPWGEILNAAEENGFRSHDTQTCGLHIHASREMFGNSEIERDLTVAKCMLLIDAYWDEYVVPFSRRKYEKLEEWARKPNSGISANDLEEIAIEKAREKAKEGRYQAINLQNYNTVEFRFFRGTLRRDTIIASIQFVDTLINYAKNTQLKDLFKKSFLEIFSNSERPELVEYLKRRNILKEGK